MTSFSQDKNQSIYSAFFHAARDTVPRSAGSVSGILIADDTIDEDVSSATIDKTVSGKAT